MQDDAQDKQKISKMTLFIMAVQDVYYLNKFQRVDANYVSQNESEPQTLVINAYEKSWGPNYLHLGLAFEKGIGSLTHAEFSAGIDFTEINRYSGAFSFDMQLGPFTLLFQSTGINLYRRLFLFIRHC